MNGWVCKVCRCSVTYYKRSHVWTHTARGADHPPLPIQGGVRERVRETGAPVTESELRAIHGDR